MSWGASAEAVPAHSVTDVESYDAVVVGGGLYAGRWHKDARRFVRRHGRVLTPACRYHSAAVRSTPRPPRRTFRPSPVCGGS